KLEETSQTYEGSPLVRYIEKRKELQETSEHLEKSRKSYKEQINLIKFKKEELEKKSSQMLNSYKAYENFFQENEKKALRSKTNVRLQQQQSVSLESELNRVSCEQQKLESEKEAKESECDKLKYLEQYLLNSFIPECSSIDNLISQYSVLSNTRNELNENYERDSQKLQTFAKQYAMESEEKHSKLLILSSKLTGLQNTLEDAEQDSQRWQAKWQHIQTTAAKKTLQLGKTKM
ncbi:MAG: Coiled-coil domain-containing protein 42, partial [Paramarteilia canceri]